MDKRQILALLGCETRSRISCAAILIVLDCGRPTMNIRYRVDLSEAERAQLTALLNGGKHAARKIKRAQILLAADAGVSDDVIASSVSVGGSTVYRTKRRFVEGNLEMALSRRRARERRASYPARRRRCWSRPRAPTPLTRVLARPRGASVGRWTF
jgi:transposase